MSLKLNNETPFSADIFEQYNLAGEIVHCVAVRGTFTIVDDSYLELAEMQEPILWTDEFQGDPQDAVLTRQADFVLYKPATDITIAGHSYAPGETPQSSWLAGVRVTNESGAVVAEKILRVFGPRMWHRPYQQGRTSSGAAAQFVLGAAEPVRRVPLQWRYSAGGRLLPTGASEAGYDMRNPVGVGMPGWDGNADNRAYPAPLFESLTDPVRDPAREYAPENFCAIHPAWATRLPFAGTFDEAWQDDRWPLMPQDFDFRFYNCAAPGLIIEPWLTGGERIELLNMSPVDEKLIFAIPAVRLSLQDDFGNAHAFRLDGVHIDTDQAIARLTWRAGVFASTDVSDLHLRILREVATPARRERAVALDV